MRNQIQIFILSMRKSSRLPRLKSRLDELKLKYPRMIFNELIGKPEFQIKFNLSFFAIKSQSLIICFSLH